MERKLKIIEVNLDLSEDQRNALNALQSDLLQEMSSVTAPGVLSIWKSYLVQRRYKRRIQETLTKEQWKKLTKMWRASA